MMFWVWAGLIVAAVLAFVALLFGQIRVPVTAPAGNAPEPGRRWPLFAGGAIVLLAAAALFGWMARPPASAPEAAPLAQAKADDPQRAEASRLLAQLEARMAKSPDDPEGWQLLGWTRFQMGQYPAAVTAYSRAETLAPQDGETQSALGEAMVMAAGGTITPDARARFTRALQLLPADPRARYYLAAAKDQGGDTKGAIDDWITLANQSPPDAPITIELRNLIGQRAREAGIDIAGRLTTASSATPPTAPAPNAAQVAEAQAMPAQDRQAMIQSMVDRLDARLQDASGDAAGWQRLIRARMVLGQKDDAAKALARAEVALAADPAGLAAVRAEAKAVGLGG